MQIEPHLEYDAILTQPTEPTHLALRLTAPTLGGTRAQPIALSVVLDRSASMSGAPLEQAKDAVRMLVRNLRRNDRFALTVFDSEAHTVLPLRPIEDRDALLQVIDQIDVGGCTNLSAGWMLGRDELKQAPAGLTRRLLLLTDGVMNAGLTDPDQVNRAVALGLESHAIRTSTLGFGDGYEEDLLSRLAATSGGAFYDAQSPERLPAIFAAELDGLQRLVVQNLRVRLQPLMFCEGVVFYGHYPWKDLDEHRVEITIGDLVSEEQRTLLFGLALSALPPGPDGTPIVTLDEEALLTIEVAWDEIADEGIASKTWTQTIHARRVQHPADATLNEEMVPWIATQQAGQAVADAIRADDAGRSGEAIQALRETIQRLAAYPAKTDRADGLRLLRRTLDRLETDGRFTPRTRKLSSASSHDYVEMSSTRLFSAEETAEEHPSYKRRRPPEPEEDA